MKNKIVMTIATLTLAVGLLLSVSAQQPGGGNNTQTRPNTPPKTGAILTPKPGPTKVNLTCQMGTGDVLANVNIRNSTGQTIQSGAVIHYNPSAGSSGTFTLTTALAPNQFKKIGEAPYPFTCSAWYFKN